MNKSIDILLYLSLALAITSIVCIGMEIPFFFSFWSYDTTKNLNQILLNLSYSYCAGYLFYLFTSILPSYMNKKIVGKAILLRVSELEQALNGFMLEFGRGTTLNYTEAVENNEICKKILISKDWNVIVPEIKKYKGIEISYLRFLDSTCNQIEREIGILITTYINHLSSDHLALLEEMRSAEFIDQVHFLNSIKNMKIADEGRESLINHFIKLLNLYNKFKQKMNTDFS